MGTFITTVLAFAFVFGIVVVVHEGGHFLAAKKMGIGVYEFSIGFGKKIFEKKYKGTLYSIGLIPLGGFVRLAGLDDEGKKVPKKNRLLSKKYLGKNINRQRRATNEFGISGGCLFCLIYSSRYSFRSLK